MHARSRRRGRDEELMDVDGETDEEADDMDEGDEPSVVLALSIKGGRTLGVAAYNEMTGELVVDQLEGAVCCPPFRRSSAVELMKLTTAFFSMFVQSAVSSNELREAIQSIKSSVRPTVILVPNALLTDAQGEEMHKLLVSPTNGSERAPSLKLLKSSLFDIHVDRVLRTLRVKELLAASQGLTRGADENAMELDMSRAESHTLLSSVIPFDQVT